MRPNNQFELSLVAEESSKNFASTKPGLGLKSPLVSSQQIFTLFETCVMEIWGSSAPERNWDPTNPHEESCDDEGSAFPTQICQIVGIDCTPELKNKGVQLAPEKILIFCHARCKIKQKEAEWLRGLSVQRPYTP